MSTAASKRATETKGFSVPETKKTTQQIEDKLIRARVQMLMVAPFFGNLATRLNFIDATAWCPTLATDGKNFYYNRNFVDWLDGDENIFGVGHEVLHCVYDHLDPERRGDRDPRLWNIANDYVVNADLVDAKIGKQITKIPICFDWKYRGMVSEEVYDDLFDKAVKDGRVINIESFDMHLDLDGEGDGEGDDANDGSKGPIRYSKEERERIRDEFKNAVIQSAKAAGAGNLPGGVKRLLKDLLNPQLDWRQLLAMQIQSVIKSDYTMMRPSRKGVDAGIYLPGMDYEETVDLAIALDLSGSINDDMSLDFMSEIKGIMDQYSNFRVHIFCFDTAVHNPQTFTENNMSEFMEYDLVGGGGTDFDCCFNYMKEVGLVPKKFVMFTDGYPWGSWGDENYCDTLFIVHGGRNGDVPQSPFGITVPYTKDSK